MFGIRFTTALVILCVLESSAQAVKPNLKVGVVRPKSGPMAPIGEELNNGIMMAYKKLKDSKHKGLASRVKIIQEDDGGKSSTAITATEKLINQHRVHILIGSISNTLNHSIADIAARKNKLLILPIGTDTDITAKGKSIFSISLTESQQGAALGKFASNFLKKTKALILEETDNPYSHTLAKSFQNNFSGNTEVLHYLPRDDSILAVAGQAIKSDQEVTFIPGFYTDAKKLLRAFKSQGVSSTFLGGDGWDTYSVRDVFGLDFSGHYYYTPYSAQDPHPAMQKFIRNFELEFKKPPSLAAFAGYEAFNLALYAYKTVESNRTTPLQDFLLRAKKLPSLTGQMRMSSSRSPIKPATIMVTTPQGSRFMTRVAP